MKAVPVSASRGRGSSFRTRGSSIGSGADGASATGGACAEGTAVTGGRSGRGAGGGAAGAAGACAIGAEHPTTGTTASPKRAPSTSRRDEEGEGFIGCSSASSKYQPGQQKMTNL